MPYPQDSIDAYARDGDLYPPARLPRWAKVVMATLAIALSVWVGLRVREVRQQAALERCATNLKRIGQAMLLYSVDNRNRYPASFATLARSTLRDGPVDRTWFACPASSDPAPAVDDADRGGYRLIADTMPMSIDIAQYGYSRSGSATAEQCVAIEVPGRHADGVHVLHADGSVQFRQISKTRGVTWAHTQDDVIHNRPIRWPASQPWR